MSLVPPTITGKIEFFNSKNAPWSASAVAIGTTAAAVAALATKVTTAQTKLAAAVAAREAAKNATADLNLAVRDMASAGADIIRQIRAKGAIDGPGVFILAEIPGPATPAPVPPPGKPVNFVVTLEDTGALKLKWKCPNPPGSVGTIYQIARRIGATGDFLPIGATGLRNFTDDTVPAGTVSVTYRITAQRSTVSGPPALFLVNFGVAGGGQMTATVESFAPKLAA